MKVKILVFSMLILIIAYGCSKETRLEALKKQSDRISQKIDKLEREIAADIDSSTLEPSGTFVSVEDLTYQPFNHYIEVLGKLDGDENVAVYPETMGIIQDIYVNPGDPVHEGKVLAKVSDAAYQGQLKSLESNLELATETFLKQEALWQQQIGSEIQYIQAKTTKESLEAQITGLKRQIDMTLIKSPVSGTVEESMVKVGQSVSASFPAFRVVSFNHLKVTAEVAEAYTSKVNPGDEVIVYLLDIEEEIAARVSFCSRYINPTNRTFIVEAQLNTSSTKIKANMVAVMKINDYQSPESFVLPINIVQNDNKGSYVLLAQEENSQFIARKRSVQVGQVYNGLAEITQGLDLESKIITSGYLNLNEGEIIRF